MTQFNMRCTAEEMDRWRAAAGELPLATWVKRVLNAAVAGEEAVKPLETPTGSTGPETPAILAEKYRVW